MCKQINSGSFENNVTFKLFCLQIIYIYIYIEVSKVDDQSRRQPEGSLFNSYYTEVLGRTLLLSQDCSTLPLLRTLFCRVLSKEVSSTIFKVFGMTQPWTEPRSPEPLANTVPTKPMSPLYICYWVGRFVMFIFGANGHGWHKFKS